MEVIPLGAGQAFHLNLSNLRVSKRGTEITSAPAWGGNWKGFEPGYTVFRTDGEKLHWERKTFAWQHQLEPEDTLERQKIVEREAFEKQQVELLAQETKG